MAEQLLENIDYSNPEQLKKWLLKIQKSYGACSEKIGHLIIEKNKRPNEKLSQQEEQELVEINGQAKQILAELENLKKLSVDDISNQELTEFLIDNSEAMENLENQIQFEIGHVVEIIGENYNPKQAIKESQDLRISKISQLAEQKVQEERSNKKKNGLKQRSSIYLVNSAKPDSIKLNMNKINKTTKKINKYLTKVVQDWKNILENGKDASFHEQNVPFMEDLLLLIKSALTENTKEAFQSLLDSWNTQKYSQWNDRVRWDQKKLEFLLREYDESADKDINVKEAEIKIKELETKLELSKQETQDYLKSLNDFKDFHNKILEETKEKSKEDYQELYKNHIDSQNKNELMNFAETEYKMVTREKHNQIKINLAKSQKEVQKLEEKREELQINNAQLESDIVIYQEKAGRAERKTDNFNNLCGSYIEEGSQLKNELEKEKQKNAILEKKIKDLQEQLAKQDNPEEIIHSDLDSEFNFSDLDSDIDTEEENEDDDEIKSQVSLNEEDNKSEKSEASLKQEGEITIEESQANNQSNQAELILTEEEITTITPFNTQTSEINIDLPLQSDEGKQENTTLAQVEVLTN